MRWDGMGWDEMGWDGMGWDVGRDGVWDNDSSGSFNISLVSVKAVSYRLETDRFSVSPPVCGG